MESTEFQPSLFRAARQYPILVLGAAVLFGVLAILASNMSESRWRAEATVVVEDPATGQVFEAGRVANPQRYLAAQVAILQSRQIAASVQELVDDSNPLSVNEILERRRVTPITETDVIGIEFRADNEARAVAYANAFVEAYRNYREEATAARFRSAIDGLTDSINAVEAEIASIASRIEDLTTPSDAEEIGAELASAVERLLALPPGADLDEVMALRARIETLQGLQNLEGQGPVFSVLLDLHRQTVERHSQLVIRRDQLRVDSDLASTGLVAVSEATEAGLAMGLARLAVAGLLLGALVGAGLAYSRALRNRVFSNRGEPEVVLGVPALAEVPRFHAEGYPLVVLSTPTSAEAEAFRFASNAVVRRSAQRNPLSASTIVAVSSSVLGEGKTLVAANLGIAMATHERSILVIDADFGDPTLTEMLVGEKPDHQGITDLTLEGALIGDVVIPVDVGNGRKVDLLTRGRSDVTAPEFFAARETRQTLERLRSYYDFILIDCPPLLQVSYASTVAALADCLVIVVPHQSKVSNQEELATRVELLGTPVLGYVYNKAPRRPEMQERHGSMKDPLGVTGGRTQAAVE